ncbi:alpha-galactosidase [Erysipelotrichaceae bacterium RD49]|nr:alpha-galactosidase [Erysipelotrichaceae bacterium RD49]
MLNPWESFYYDVSLAKLEAEAKAAKEAGLEMLVMDDGWFRASSRDPIGDWQVDSAKLPGGIPKAADLVHSYGLKFGLWFEPEAVSANSKLYQAHPDWIIQSPYHAPLAGRHEYLLDLAKPEVVEHIKTMLSQYLPYVDYIKWDMNRPQSDSGNTFGYIKGLYCILEWINTQFPHVEIETCASGGARLDAGILHYSGKNWTSDNTDPIFRQDIQENFARIFPPEALCAHVSVAKNHQTGRISSSKTHFDTAKLFNFGYELKLSDCTPEEFAEVKAQIEQVKADRQVMKQARFFVLDPSHPNYKAWLKVSKDQKHASLVIFQKEADPTSMHTYLRLQGLDPHQVYELEGQLIPGDVLMNAGIELPYIFATETSYSFDLRAV